METLRIGQRFPDLDVHVTDGSTLRLPEAMRGRIGILLFYRGHW